MKSSQQNYLIMPRSELSDGTITLRAVAPKDIESIRQWRNAQMDVLRQNEPITPEQQIRYFSEHIWPDKTSKTPRQILLAIEKNNKLIGYGGLVHISWPYKRAEVSFLLKPSLEQNKKALVEIFSKYLILIQSFSFEDLKLNRLTTETYENRIPHIQALESVGFKLEGRLRKHVIIDGILRDAVIHASLQQEWHNYGRNKRFDTSILITSASSKVPLVRAVKEAIHRLSYSVKVFAGDLDPLSITRFEADDFWQMPRINDDAIPELINGCQSRGISIILPTRDGELDFWARHSETFAQAGIKVIVSAPDSIERCRDKLAFANFGFNQNLPIIPASTNAEDFGSQPLVVKERFGSASRGLGLNMMPDAAQEHACKLEEPIFQPYIHGPEISIDGWIDKHGKVVGVVLRHRDRVVSGESQVTTTFSDAALEEQALRVLEALELRGPVVLQAIVVNGKLQIIECNPRFGGASTASIAVGLDILYWSLAESISEEYMPIFKRAPGNIKQIRMPVDRVIYDPYL